MQNNPCPSHRLTSPKRILAPPALRISLSVAWIFVIALLPNRAWLWHLVTVVALGVFSCAARLSWTRLLKRTCLLCPFIALTAVGLLWQPDWVLRAANLLIKATLSLWVMSLLMHLTPFHEFVEGLRQLRFPPVWVDLFAFLFRYFAVLSDEWRRMQMARHARTFQPGRTRELLLLAHSLGSLFIRAYERAERVHQAMLARGYELS